MKLPWCDYRKALLKKDQHWSSDCPNAIRPYTVPWTTNVDQLACQYMASPDRNGSIKGHYKRPRYESSYIYTCNAIELKCFQQCYCVSYPDALVAIMIVIPSGIIEYWLSYSVLSNRFPWAVILRNTMRPVSITFRTFPTAARNRYQGYNVYFELNNFKLLFHRMFCPTSSMIITLILFISSLLFFVVFNSPRLSDGCTCMHQ